MKLENEGAVLQAIADRLERLANIELHLLRVVSHSEHIERKIMSLEQALIDAGNSAAAAIAGLNTKVDGLLSAFASAELQLKNLIAVNSTAIPTGSVQSVIDALGKATAAAGAEADKVAAAVTQASAPAAPADPVPAPAPAPAPVDAPAPAPVPPADPAAPASVITTS